MGVGGMPMVNFMVSIEWIQLACGTVEWWAYMNMVEFPDQLGF
jgi:hypothetical protein